MVEVAGTVLAALVAEASKMLAASTESTNPTGNAGQNDRLHQISKTDDPESRTGIQEGEEEPSFAAPGQGSLTYPLATVMEACPDMMDYARGGIRTWPDLVGTAGLVRSILGISPSSWREAQEVLGVEAAAVLIAAILQRAEHIRSPGGYLRALVERKRAGLFSLGPVLAALLRRQQIGRENLVQREPLPRLSPKAVRVVGRIDADKQGQLD